jgi:hypothetical protein
MKNLKSLSLLFSQDHIARLQESLKQWSSVMYVSAESIRNQGQMHLIQINVEQSTANAGLATDQEIRDMGFQVFINEETRYDIYERSVEDMKRFESILDRFSLKDRHEKSVRLFLKALENKEKSSQGQRAFREELILHPNHSPSGNRNKKRIALATTPSTAFNQIVADQVCKYHPGKLVRHSEKDCTLNPSNANTKQKAGAKKDPCSWCTRNYPKLAGRHLDSACWFNPKSPAYDPTKTPNNKGNPAVSSQMTDRLSKLESNSKSIKSLLTKMTKSAAKVSGPTTAQGHKR